MTRQDPPNPANGAAPAVTRGRTGGKTGGNTGGKPRATSAARKRIPFTVVWLGLLAASLAAAAIFVFDPEFSRERSGELTTSLIDQHRLGMIVSDDGTTRCARGTFDNRTGRISGGPVTCEMNTVVDGQRVTVPVGTAHTLGAISNAFR